MQSTDLADAGLTGMAREVLLRKATEPPRTWLLADGVHYDAGAEGVYVCALSGVPLYGSESARPSSTGWPSFEAYPVVRACTSIDSPCECEHNNLDSLDARRFSSVVLAVAPAVTMDEASSLSTYSKLMA